MRDSSSEGRAAQAIGESPNLVQVVGSSPICLSAMDRCRWKSDGKMRMRRVRNLYLPGNRFVSVTLKSLHFLLFFRKGNTLYYEKTVKGDLKYEQSC